MISHILRKRGLGNAFIKLYNEKQVSFHGGVEFEILNRELRVADVVFGNYVWRNPNIYEFYLQTRKIARDDLNKEKRDLVVLIGLKILDKYSSENIQEKYRSSYMNG